MEPKIGLMLRLPQSLRDLVADEAKREGRSLNSQIIHMLTRGLIAEQKGNG